MSDQEKLNFFVYVIESPSESDFYHCRGEGRIIQQAVNLNGINCIVKTAISRDAFKVGLYAGLNEAMTQFPGLYPIIHISAHGNEYGIHFSNNENIQWHELKEWLKPINKILQGYLVVCMSTCKGYSGVRMAMWPQDTDYPYYALIGNSGQPSWAETAVGYTALYHHLCRGESGFNAVRAMRIASGNPGFFFENAQETRKSYIKYLEGISASQAQAALHQQIEQSESPSLGKFVSTLYR